jgi:hypothetical protein
MGYSADTRERIRSLDPWKGISEETSKVLEQVLGLKETREQCESIVRAMTATVKELTVIVKVSNLKTGDFITYIEANRTSIDATMRVLNDFHDRNKIPHDLVGIFEAYGGAPLCECFEEVHEECKHYISWFTEDIELLNDLFARAIEHERTVRNIWAHVCTGENLEEFMDSIYELYLINVKIYVDMLKDKAGKPRKQEPSPPVGAGGPKNEPPRGGSKQTFAEKTKEAKKGPSLEKRWGDYTSSDEEVEDLSSLLDSFVKKGSDTKPHIEVPKDFEFQLPHVHRAWKKLCNKWEWEMRISDSNMVAEGYVGKSYGSASEDKRAELLAAMNEKDSIAFNTLISYLLCVLFKPESIKTGEQGNLISGYVTSLFLKDRYKDNDDAMKLLKVSLKGTDAGEQLISARIYQCFKTGSKAAQQILTSVEKMLKRIVAKSSDDEKDSVCQHADLCYTSYQGMMQNSFHVVSKRVTETVEETDRKGKSKKTRKTVIRLGRDRPNLNASGFELTQKEQQEVRARESSFNKLDEVIAAILKKKEDSKDPLRTAKVVKCVVDLAYDKIAALRMLNKQRRNVIRAKSQELAGEKKVSSSDWMKARKELMGSFDPLEKEALDNLSWDSNAISESLRLD